MTTHTLTLSDFLLARIAEDEERWARIGADPGMPWGSTLANRVLAECEAKKRIVSMCDNVLQSFSAQNGGPRPA